MWPDACKSFACHVSGQRRLPASIAGVLSVLRLARRQRRRARGASPAPPRNSAYVYGLQVKAQSATFAAATRTQEGTYSVGYVIQVGMVSTWQAGACFGLSAACCRTGFLLAARQPLCVPAGLAASVGLTSGGFALQTCGLKDGNSLVVGAAMLQELQKCNYGGASLAYHQLVLSRSRNAIFLKLLNY